MKHTMTSILRLAFLPAIAVGIYYFIATVDEINDSSVGGTTESTNITMLWRDIQFPKYNLGILNQPESVNVTNNRGFHSKGTGQSTFFQRLQAVRWKPLHVCLGLTLLVYLKLWSWKRKETPAKDWEVACYKLLPLNALSRAFGYVTDVNLPPYLKSHVLSWYVKTFDCNMKEAVVEDLHTYNNLGDLFRRAIKPDVRPISSGDCVVSPSDGKVLSVGNVSSGKIEQIKGINYQLETFLGPCTWNTNPAILHGNADYQHMLSTRNTNRMYQVTIYLAPGDYHRFHSPVDWDVEFRRHFPGELFSVSPLIAKRIAGLFSLNERVVYTGSWKHGFFSFIAVGATNVGSIKVYHDKDLQTNCKNHKKGNNYDARFIDELTYKKGEAFGEFNMGSTIVLVFEAPHDFELNIKPGDTVKFGQSLLEKRDSVQSEITSTGMTMQSVQN